MMTNKKKIQIIKATGLLAIAALNAAEAIQNLKEAAKDVGRWKEATPDEAEAVQEEIDDMVATYSSQVN